MTQQESKAIKTAVLIAGALALLGMAWASKANVSDLARVERKVDALLTLECRERPADSICGDYVR